MKNFLKPYTPLKFLFSLVGTSVVFTLIVVFYIVKAVSSGLPSLEQLENPKQNIATTVISADGVVLDHFYIQKRLYIPLDSIPKQFLDALIATEDKDFYSHWGVYARRILNAAVKNFFAGRVTEGASTITMQLARNLYFNQENTVSRKLKEAITAMQIEKTFTKKEILEMYANTVYFGRGAYGIMVASSVYFNKLPNELTLPECAFLVGILKSPGDYNGMVKLEKAIRRRNVVLSLMRDQDYINSLDYLQAINEPIVFSKRANNQNRKTYLAPHFVEMIRQLLNKDERLRDYDLYRDGLIIYTTLNSKIQKYSELALEKHLSQFQKTFDKAWTWSKNKRLLDDLIQKAILDNPAYFAALSDEDKSAVAKNLRKNRSFIDSIKNAATTVQSGLVIIDPTTGAIIAMVGASPKFMNENSDIKYSLNHVTQIRRQPGSSFKPVVYASAMENGLTPTSSVECGPYSYKMPSGEVWSPRGDGGGAEGETVTLFAALARSINTVAARLITQYTTPAKVIQLALKMGIKSRLQAVPALSLGAGGELTPLELTAAYTTFANEGVYVEPYAITRIEDQYGNILYENKKVVKASDVLSQKIAQQITQMLQGVINYGTGSKVKEIFKNCDVAGKTGTTNDYADAWFIGYTPQLLCGVWVGFDDRRVTFTGSYAYAAKAAVPIWAYTMKYIYSDSKLPFKQRKFAFRLQDSVAASFMTPVSEVQPDAETDIQAPVENSNEKEVKLEEASKKTSVLPKLPKPEKQKDDKPEPDKQKVDKTKPKDF